MKVSVNIKQIGYFKPEITARRLKTDGYLGGSHPVLFLGYLGLIRLLPELAEGIRPLCPALYHKKMQKICLTT